jgi:hypothetical protein
MNLDIIVSIITISFGNTICCCFECYETCFKSILAIFGTLILTLTYSVCLSSRRVWLVNNIDTWSHLYCVLGFLFTQYFLFCFLFVFTLSFQMLAISKLFIAYKYIQTRASFNFGYLLYAVWFHFAYTQTMMNFLFDLKEISYCRNRISYPIDVIRCLGTVNILVDRSQQSDVTSEWPFYPNQVSRVIQSRNQCVKNDRANNWYGMYQTT